MNCLQKINIFMFFICSQIFLLFSPFLVFGTTLHVLIAGDARGEIKDSVRKDVQKMRHMVKFLSSKMGIKNNFKSIGPKQLSSRTIKKCIKKAPITTKDIFIFHFSGHGFQSKIHSKWPLIYFSKRDRTLDLGVIIKAIEKKRPQLSIILCDACNSAFRSAKFKADFPGSTFNKQVKTDKINQLFLKQMGSVIICAAKPNGNAWASKHGGLMTLTFLSELRKEIKRQSPSWKHFLTAIKKKSSRLQEPLIQSSF